MTEIKPKAYFEPAKRAKFMEPQPAGWVIFDDTTGKRLGADIRYGTEQEANDAIERTVAAHLALIQRNEQRAAEREAELAAEQTAREETHRRYDVVQHGMFGEGRVYRDQPGATQYDDGSGRYSVQIWDNA